MSTATISENGQLRIPKHIRDMMNLSEGDQVIFVIDGERIVLYPVRRHGLLELRGAFPGLRSYPGRTVEREAAIGEAIRAMRDEPEV